jgi:hypothetical protein
LLTIESNNKNTHRELETDDLDTLLAEAWPQLNRETQRRWLMYVTRSTVRQSSKKQSLKTRFLSMTRGRRGADTETAIDELTTRILAIAEKTRVLHGLSRSLKEMAAGDLRPIEDVIREAKREQAQSCLIMGFPFGSTRQFEKDIKRLSKR